MLRSIPVALAILLVSAEETLARCNGGSRGSPFPLEQGRCDEGIFAVWRINNESIDPNSERFSIETIPFNEESEYPVNVTFHGDMRAEFGSIEPGRQSWEAPNAFGFVAGPSFAKIQLGVARDAPDILGVMTITFYGDESCVADIDVFR